MLLMDRRRLILLGLALLCASQVIHMGYRACDIQDLRSTKNPTDELLTVWGLHNHTIPELFVLLARMHHYEAMAVLKPFVTSKFHPLLYNGEANVKNLVAKGRISNDTKDLRMGVHNLDLIEKPARRKAIANRGKQAPVMTNEPDDASTKKINGPIELVLHSSDDNSLPIKLKSSFSTLLPQIPYDELTAVTDNWNAEKNLLGKGGFAYVFRVLAKPTEKESSNDADYENDDGGGPDPEDEEEESNSSPSGPVQLLSESQSFTVKEGGSVLLPCKFLNIDNVAVQWSKDTVPLFLDESRLNAPDRYERLSDGTLKISDVQPSDNSGDFRCEVLTKEDPKSLKHSLLVEKNSNEEKLVKLIPAAEVDIMQGETVTIGCEALPGLKYNGFVLSRRGERLHVNNGENGRSVFLVVHNATRHYAGDYQCLVETGDAKPIIKHITLKVKHAPEIEYEKEIIHERSRDRAFYYTGPGQETNITCIVHSHPPVKRLHWLKDGQRLKIDGQRLMKSDPRKSHHVLTIKNTSKADLGQYQCIATNDLGNATGPKIHLVDTPSQPRFHNGRAVANSIVFEWKLVSYKPIVETELQIRKDDDLTPWKNLEDVKVISSEGNEHIVRGTITGIEAGKYEARLRARNDEEHSIDDKNVMWGPYSDNKKFDGEYKEGADAESVRDSAVKPTLTMTMLLLTITPLAYLCL